MSVSPCAEKYKVAGRVEISCILEIIKYTFVSIEIDEKENI